MPPEALAAAEMPERAALCTGMDAAAACGQLRNRHQKEPLEEFAVPA